MLACLFWTTIVQSTIYPTAAMCRAPATCCRAPGLGPFAQVDLSPEDEGGLGQEAVVAEDTAGAAEQTEVVEIVKVVSNYCHSCQQISELSNLAK